MMSEWEKAARLGLEIARDIQRELPACKRCKCNWPKKDIDTNGLCLNCRAKEEQRP